MKDWKFDSFPMYYGHLQKNMFKTTTQTCPGVKLIYRTKTLTEYVAYSLKYETTITIKKIKGRAGCLISDFFLCQGYKNRTKRKSMTFQIILQHSARFIRSSFLKPSPNGCSFHAILLSKLYSSTYTKLPYTFSGFIKWAAGSLLTAPTIEKFNGSNNLRGKME